MARSKRYGIKSHPHLLAPNQQLPTVPDLYSKLGYLDFANVVDCYQWLHL